jgi:AraC-like DNA-binding protein
LEAVLPASGILHGQILRRESGAARLLSEHLHTLSQTLPDMAAREAPMLAEAAISMVAACFRPTAETRERAGASMVAATLDTIKRHIEARLDRPSLTPASIATAFRLSRSSLYRLFEPLGGVSGYIQERRLARAHAALLQPANRGRRVHEIAFDCGFSSEAHFSRSFRSAYGIAPSALQKEGGRAARLTWLLEDEYNYARWIAQFRLERKRAFF